MSDWAARYSRHFDDTNEVVWQIFFEVRVCNLSTEKDMWYG